MSVNLVRKGSLEEGVWLGNKQVSGKHLDPESTDYERFLTVLEAQITNALPRVKLPSKPDVLKLCSLSVFPKAYYSSIAARFATSDLCIALRSVRLVQRVHLALKYDPGSGLPVSDNALNRAREEFYDCFSTNVQLGASKPRRAAKVPPRKPLPSFGAASTTSVEEKQESLAALGELEDLLGSDLEGTDTDDAEDTYSGEIEVPDLTGDLPHLFTSIEGVWNMVGWAFTCSTVPHPDFVRIWRQMEPFLQFILEMLEQNYIWVEADQLGYQLSRLDPKRVPDEIRATKEAIDDIYDRHDFEKYKQLVEAHSQTALERHREYLAMASNLDDKIRNKTVLGSWLSGGSVLETAVNAILASLIIGGDVNESGNPVNRINYYPLDKNDIPDIADKINSMTDTRNDVSTTTLRSRFLDLLLKRYTTEDHIIKIQRHCMKLIRYPSVYHALLPREKPLPNTLSRLIWSCSTDSLISSAEYLRQMPLSKETLCVWLATTPQTTEWLSPELSLRDHMCALYDALMSYVANSGFDQMFLSIPDLYKSYHEGQKMRVQWGAKHNIAYSSRGHVAESVLNDFIHSLLTDYLDDLSDS
ncbi:hypothetical protein TRVA0_006S02652 [Trichomonascus vanleenenianus]|uniref:uncharacterized protein n=1 Tax=Trichomonascus vanleenenianus TaxID=2268995 RepID=UPI003ECB42BE